MSYLSPSTSAKDLVRFLLQDTSAPFALSDGEITATLAMQGDDMARTLNTLCTVLIAKYSSRPHDEQLEGLSVTWGDMAGKYRALASDFARMAANGTLPVFGAVIEAPTPAGPQLFVDDESVWGHLA